MKKPELKARKNYLGFDLTLIILITGFFLVLGNIIDNKVCYAKIFNQETLPVENPSDIPDPLSHYEVKDQAVGILGKITNVWKKINAGGVDFWSKNIEPHFGKYIDRAEQNIKQGWAEEKEEYKESIFKALGIVWEKIKDFIANKIK